MYGLATDMGTPSSGPLGRELLRQVGRRPDGGERLLRVLNHELAPSKLFTPGLIGRGVVAVARRRPAQIPAMAGELVSAARTEVRRSRKAAATLVA
jgi:hypothetical protein